MESMAGNADWAAYEREKKKLQGLPPEEYEAALKELARRMTVTSGLKCLELYQDSGPLGSLVRTLLGSSIWRSTQCYLTWKISGTPAKRLLFRLVPSTPRTGGTDAPLWPTTTKFDATCGDGTCHAMKLIQAVKMFPTPIATDWKNRGCKDYRKNREHQLQTEVGGQLNPTFVEWIMGFPLGWTELNALETP